MIECTFNFTYSMLYYQNNIIIYVEFIHLPPAHRTERKSIYIYNIYICKHINTSAIVYHQLTSVKRHEHTFRHLCDVQKYTQCILHI